MATFLRFFTILCIVVGAAANAYIWRVTNDWAWAWDFIHWPARFWNVWINPTGMAGLIFVAAVIPVILGLLLGTALLAKALSGSGAAAVRRARRFGESLGGKDDEGDVPAFEGVVIPRLGTPESESEAVANTGPGRFAVMRERAAETIGDLKEAFGIDFVAWKKNRMRARGDDRIVPVSGDEPRWFMALFSRRKPKAKPVPLLADPAIARKMSPAEEVAFEIMEWYGLWGKAGPAGRTEAMEAKAYELKAKATQAVQDLVIERHQHTGISAIDALLAATMYEKGIGGFAEDEASPVEQPEADDLIDHEVRADRADSVFGSSSDVADEEFREERREDRPEIGDANLESFFDRYRPSKTGKPVPAAEASGEEIDEFEQVRRAGQGTVADFLGVLNEGPIGAGEGREGGTGEGKDEPAPAGGSASPASGDNGAVSWDDDLPWDGGARTETGPDNILGDDILGQGYGGASEVSEEADTIADDEMPRGRDWKKWAARDEVEEELAGGNRPSGHPETDPIATQVPAFDAVDFPTWSDTPSSAKPSQPGEESRGVSGDRWQSRGSQVEEDGAVSALLASVSPDGPIGDIREEDLKENPEDLALPVSTVIPPEEIEKTIRRMDKNWLRIVTGEVDKGARSLERQFIREGLAELKSRHVFIPALWSQLNRVVDYQTQAYAWEHFGDTPPEHLRNAKQRAEFLFDVVTSIVALAKQVPSTDLEELLELKKGTEQARWLAAGRAERMVAELKKSGAVEPGTKPAEAEQVAPDASREMPRKGMDATRRAMAEAAQRVADAIAGRNTETPRSTMSGPALPEIADEDLIDPELGAEPEEDGNSRPVEAEAWTGGTPEAFQDEGAKEEAAPVEGAEENPAGDQGQTGASPSSPELPSSDTPGDVSEAPAADAEPDPPNGPASPSAPLSPEEARKAFIDEIAELARKDGLSVRSPMRFTHETASIEDRTVDVIIGKETISHGTHQVPGGRRVVAVVVVDVPEGSWRTGKGENGRPQLKWAGKVIGLRAWAYHLASEFYGQYDTQAIKKVLILRMDPLATIEDSEGNADREAVAALLADADISVRTSIWSPAEWREQVALPVLS